MGDEEDVAAPPTILVYGDAESYIGKSLFPALTTYGAEEGAPPTYEVTKATADSDVTAFDIVICDIYNKDPAAIGAATAAINTLTEVELSKEVTFILLSSVLTWGRTPAELEDPDAEEVERLTISDADFGKRRCLPTFKPNLTCERLVYKASKKEHLKTFVVCSGLLFGNGETDDCFHSLFKSAWHCGTIKMYGNGENWLPTIHVTDLANAVAKCAAEPPEQRYVLAVTSNSTLKSVCEGLSKILGGKIESVPDEEVILMEGSDAEFLTIDQKLSSEVVGGLMESVSPDGLVSEEMEGMGAAVAEYRVQRNLSPVTVFVHGPPSIGATAIAAKAAKQYKLVHLTKAGMIEAALAGADEVGPGGKLSRQIKKKMDKTGKVPLSLCLQWVRRTLNSKDCVNRGYVLECFPENYKQAKNLFNKRPGPDDDEPEEEPVDDDLDTYDIPEPDPDAEPEPAEEEEVEEEEEEGYEDEEGPPENKVLTPEFVLELKADPEALKETVQGMVEADAVALYGEDVEAGFTGALELWQAVQDAKPAVVDWFEDQDINPVWAEPLAGGDAVAAIAGSIGAPHNYGPTAEELAEEARVKAAAEAQAAAEAKALAEKAAAEEAALQELRDAEMAAMQAELEREEDEILKLRSRPLRKYLMDNVIPTLTQGLIQTCKLKPVDPIEHLAAFLFEACEQQEQA
jgi:adenylate kinase